MHRRYRGWTLMSSPSSSCRMFRLICHASLCLGVDSPCSLRRLSDLSGLNCPEMSARSDHSCLCRANRLSLLSLTVWRYLPIFDQSCLFRANRRRASDNLHDLPQVASARSRMRSLNCNSFLVQVGLCMYNRCTAALLRKTSSKLLGSQA